MLHSPLIIYSCQAWIEDQLQEASIVIKNGVIHSIHKGKKLEGSIDYKDKIIMPGVIDVHVHINEPGRTSWEGFNTATRAAARGGTTTLIDMPLNSDPVVTEVKALNKKLKATQGKLHVNCGFWGGAIEGNVEEAKALIDAGCLGVKIFLSPSGIDEFPNISLENLNVLMKGIADYDVPILAHCELELLPTDSQLYRNPTSYQEYLKSRPKRWENEAIRSFVDLGKKNNCRTHIVHLSSNDMIPWLEDQKKSGARLTVETCPHYIFFEADTIADGNTLYKCAPPIRDKANNNDLKKGLRDGVLDFISTDHSPAPPLIKELESGNLLKAWGGISGMQFLLSASWTSLRAVMDLDSLIPLLTSKPAQFLGLEQTIGHLRENYQADITIWNPDTEYEVTENIIEHRHKPTPYLGKKLFGEVYATIVNGHFVFQNGKIEGLNKGKLMLKEN